MNAQTQLQNQTQSQAQIPAPARAGDILLTALAPCIWGSTYLVTTEFLPPDRPMTLSLLRALPAGLLLLLIVRQWPKGTWLWRILVLGALNFTIFWSLLFVSAYRLPGGVAAPLTSVQPLMVLVIERGLFGVPIHPLSVVIGLAGIVGVALLVLTPDAALDGLGIAAGLGAALSMAVGTVLTKYWRPPVPPLTVAAWQLTAGGLMLLPIALLLEAPLPPLSAMNIAGFLYLGLIGAALTYIFWFHGLAKLSPSVVAPLGFLSPLTAVVLGWVVLHQSLKPAQIAGIAIVLVAVWLNHRLAMHMSKRTTGERS